MIGAVPGAMLVLNASELALLQRLPRPGLPRCRDGALMGPAWVWLRLLELLQVWCQEHLGRRGRALRLLQGCFSAEAQGHRGAAPSLPPND